jgi:hypothetical protein
VTRVTVPIWRAGAHATKPIERAAPLSLFAANHISPAMGERLTDTERRRKQRKKEWNARYRDKKRGEVELLRKEVASLLATVRAISGTLAAHPGR